MYASLLHTAREQLTRYLTEMGLDCLIVQQCLDGLEEQSLPTPRGSETLGRLQQMVGSDGPASIAAQSVVDALRQVQQEMQEAHPSS